MNIKPEVIFSDQWIIIVNKPAGFLSIPDRFDAAKPNILAYLRRDFPEAMVLHRLDKETSGIMIFARDPDTHRKLSTDFEDHSIRKTYLALAEGYIREDVGRIDKPIGESRSAAGTMIISPNGKPSQTLYQVVKRYKKYTLAEADILTGRMHQIRVHFKSIGHPLAIDAVYGNSDKLFIYDIKQKGMSYSKFDEEKPLMSRTTLHAFALELIHPTTKEKMRFEAPLHRDFKALLNQLDKWG